MRGSIANSIPPSVCRSSIRPRPSWSRIILVIAAPHFFLLFRATLFRGDALIYTSNEPLGEGSHLRPCIRGPCLDLRFSFPVRFDEAEFAAHNAGAHQTNLRDLQAPIITG